jgi:hypothetical protein
MSQELFTPGPWMLNVDKEWQIHNGTAVLFDNDRVLRPTMPRNPMDWHLIAAAPELYDMVKKLIEHCPDATLAVQAYTILSNARGEY